jgi:hypothetical protein
VLAVIIRERAVAVGEAHLTSFTACLLTINSVIWRGLCFLCPGGTQPKALLIYVVYFTFMSLSRVSSYIKKGTNDTDSRVSWAR